MRRIARDRRCGVRYEDAACLLHTLLLLLAPYPDLLLIIHSLERLAFASDH